MLEGRVHIHKKLSSKVILANREMKMILHLVIVKIYFNPKKNKNNLKLLKLRMNN